MFFRDLQKIVNKKGKEMIIFVIRGIGTYYNFHAISINNLNEKLFKSFLLALKRTNVSQLAA